MQRGRVIDLRKSVNRTLPLELKRGTPPPRRKMPLKMRRRRVRALWGLALLSLLGAAIYGIHRASYLPHLSINEVLVSGERDVNPEVVRAFVATLLDNGSRPFFSRNNKFLYPRAEIERRTAAAFPRIHSVRVSRPSPMSQTLDVALEEREPFAYWCLPDRGSQSGLTAMPAHAGQAVADECYLMDEGGFIFAEWGEEATSTRKYIFRGGVGTSTTPIGHTFIPGRLSGILVLLTYLQQAGFLPLGITVEGEQDFSVPFAEGFRAYASFGRDAMGLVRDLQLILSSSELAGKMDEVDYVDLRFGNRVYFKLKGE